MNWGRFFLYFNRVANVVVVSFAGLFALTILTQAMYRPDLSEEFRKTKGEWGGGKEPFTGQMIEARGGTLVKIVRKGEEYDDRELGGIAIANPSNGKSVTLAPGADEVVVQFAILSDRSAGDGDGEGDGLAIGYLATVASDAQYRAGNMDLIVGSFPEMTRNVVARNVKLTDLPTVRGDGSIGLLMWPTDNEAQLVTIRLSDGSIIARNKVPLPAFGKSVVSRGSRANTYSPAREAPENKFH